jgi:hypothetical protein
MGHSRTPTQNTAGDGFPADPIDGSSTIVGWSLPAAFSTEGASRIPPHNNDFRGDQLDTDRHFGVPPQEERVKFAPRTWIALMLGR